MRNESQYASISESTNPVHRWPTRIVGTQLVTISEQKSIHTIQTVPSTLTFNKRIASWQQPASSFTLRQEAESGRRQRRQCISLDENTIHKYQQKYKESTSRIIVRRRSASEAGERDFGARSSPLSTARACQNARRCAQLAWTSL